MAFPPLPNDSNGVPVSAGYIPNDAFYAALSSARKKTDTAGNTYTALVLETIPMEDVRNQRTFLATTGILATATNPNLTQGASLFNPSGSGRTLLVTSARCLQSAGTSNTMQLNFTNTDPQLGAPTVLTIVNLSAGGSASALAGLSPVPVTSSANNASASISVTGTRAAITLAGSMVEYEFIPPGGAIILPNGAANGLLLSTIVATASTTNYIITFKWVEY
jgi:hypothetical protein